MWPRGAAGVWTSTEHAGIIEGFTEYVPLGIRYCAGRVFVAMAERTRNSLLAACFVHKPEGYTWTCEWHSSVEVGARPPPSRSWAREDAGSLRWFAQDGPVLTEYRLAWGQRQWQVCLLEGASAAAELDRVAASREDGAVEDGASVGLRVDGDTGAVFPTRGVPALSTLAWAALRDRVEPSLDRAVAEPRVLADLAAAGVPRPLLAKAQLHKALKSQQKSIWCTKSNKV